MNGLTYMACILKTLNIQDTSEKRGRKQYLNESDIIENLSNSGALSKVKKPVPLPSGIVILNATTFGQKKCSMRQ